MTLDEAIKHAREKAFGEAGSKCGEEHAELCGFLIDLKKLRYLAPITGPVTMLLAHINDAAESPEARVALARLRGMMGDLTAYDDTFREEDVTIKHSGAVHLGRKALMNELGMVQCLLDEVTDLLERVASLYASPPTMATMGNVNAHEFIQETILKALKRARWRAPNMGGEWAETELAKCYHRKLGLQRRYDDVLERFEQVLKNSAPLALIVSKGELEGVPDVEAKPGFIVMGTIDKAQGTVAGLLQDKLELNGMEAIDVAGHIINALREKGPS